MMEKIEGDTLLVFVEDIGANQYQIKQAVKKLTTQCAHGQHGVRVWWTEVCPRTSPWLACFGYCQPLWHHLNWVQLAGSKYTWFYHPKWRMGRRSSDKSNNIHPRCHLANILRMPLTYPQWEPQKLPFQRSQQEQLFSCCLPIWIMSSPFAPSTSLPPHPSYPSTYTLQCAEKPEQFWSQSNTTSCFSWKGSLAIKLAEGNLFPGILR